eukprot:797463-Rhodomonas_salina.1
MFDCNIQNFVFVASPRDFGSSGTGDQKLTRVRMASPSGALVHALALMLACACHAAAFSIPSGPLFSPSLSSSVFSSQQGRMPAVSVRGFSSVLSRKA